MKGTIQIWNSALSQVEIIRRTREAVTRGQRLENTLADLDLSPGPYSPASTRYANELVLKTIKMDKARAQLEKPLCAVFVNIHRWQLGTEL